MLYNGNIAEDSRDCYKQCENCQGRGMIYIDDGDLHDIIYQMYVHDGKNYKQLMSLYRYWKSHKGKIHCPECEGEGGFRWKE